MSDMKKEFVPKKVVYKNPYISTSLYKNADNFTSDFGIKMRRWLNKPFSFILRCATKHRVVIEKSQKLDDKKQYIFASAHWFSEDIISGLANAGRSVYVLMGSTHQIIYNPLLLAAYINGMAYVDRCNADSRKDATKKLLRVLRSGSSVFLFPEGGWNNTENKLINPLFAGPWLLAEETGCEVIPWVPFLDYNSNTIYIRIGEPLALGKLEKAEALIQLRNALATEMWLLMESHAERLERDTINIEQERIKYYEERKHEYLDSNVWYDDVWEEELTVYKDRRYPLPEDVWKTFRDVNVTYENANIIAPILLWNLEYDKMNFKKYMHENWDK